MKRALFGIVVGLAIALGSNACKKSPSPEAGKSDAGSAAASSSVPAIEREAQNAALAELGKHWTKGPDGWTTAITSGVSVAPDHYLRQFRELTVHDVEPAELSDSDRLNGFEWAGQVTFNESPCREAGDQGLVLDGMVGLGMNRQRGHWSQWVDFQPEALRVQKVKGQWQVNQDTRLLRGQPPQPQDYANAQVH
jgi:hypothetical protein